MKFADLRLAEPILRAVAAEGYQTATPIQAQTIPHVLAGRDVLGSAQTGTGKTAAFALPVLQRLAAASTGRSGKPRARCLVLCPTRELARQIAESFATYGKHVSVTGTTIFGGVNQHRQVKALRRGVDVIVATPGRLLDLMNQGHVDLRSIDTLILDEADRMLDMGFINDIERIVEQVPAERQTLLFSATMPPNIRRLAGRLLRDPATVEITPEQPTVDAIAQSVYFVTKQNKPALLAHLLETTSISRALVFTRTKHGADRVAKQLNKRDLQAGIIHGNKTQNARERALASFAAGRSSVLVATDIAARGIDVDGISHVINYDLTHEPETYVHRIGRTARAGASGHAISFCDHEERGYLAAIQHLIRKPLEIGTDCPDHTEPAPALPHHGPKSGSGGKKSAGRPNQRRRERGASGRPQGANRSGGGGGGGSARDRSKGRRPNRTGRKAG